MTYQGRLRRAALACSPWVPLEEALDPQGGSLGLSRAAQGGWGDLLVDQINPLPSCSQCPLHLVRLSRPDPCLAHP